MVGARTEIPGEVSVMKERMVLIVGAFALLTTACGSGGGSASSTPSAQTSPSAGSSASASGYHPVIDPANFQAVVDNPWFPLKPGSTYIYRGTKDGEPSRDVYVVSHETKMVDGVPCVVVDDKLYLSGVLEGRTSDSYTQDRQGNVWYFGEAPAKLGKKGNGQGTE